MTARSAPAESRLWLTLLMFAFVPLGVEGGTIRLPIVGISIVVLCAVGFGATWVGVADPWGNNEDQAHEVLTFWKPRPYLELSDEFIDAKLGTSARAGISALRDAFSSTGGALPPPAVLAAEQAQLTALMEAALAPPVQTTFRRFALVPARGPWQLGWLTHLFLHAGWMHLLGNLLFLYAAALLLEDAWGSLLFLAFYLAGGLAAALAEYALNRASGMVMVGASGAISACIGAMMVRFTTRPMRIGYVLLLIVIPKMGTFSIPVWVWSAFFGVTQLFDLVTGGTPGVAVLAHVVGFGFGAGVALAMKAAGLDRTLVGTDEATLTSLRPSMLKEVEEAQAAQQRGDLESARGLYEAARRAAPQDVDPLFGLYWLELQAGRLPQAMQHLERIVQLSLRTGQVERAREAFSSAWSSFKPSDFRPVFALQVVKALGDALTREQRRRLWARGGDEPGPLAADATLNAAELAMEARDFDDAEALLRQTATLSRGRAIDERVARLRDRLPREAPAPRLVAQQRQVMPVAIAAARADALAVQPVSGQPRSLKLGQIKAVAAGLVMVAQSGGKQKVLVVYFVLAWGDAVTPAQLLRFDSQTGGVDRLRPGVPPRDAYLQFLAWVLDQSGAVALPDRERLLKGLVPTHADLAELERALFESPR